MNLTDESRDFSSGRRVVADIGGNDRRGQVDESLVSGFAHREVFQSRNQIPVETGGEPSKWAAGDSFDAIYTCEYERSAAGLTSKTRIPAYIYLNLETTRPRLESRSGRDQPR